MNQKAETLSLYNFFLCFSTEDSARLFLQKWLMAIYMMTTARKCIPSTQMVCQLSITQKCMVSSTKN